MVYIYTLAHPLTEEIRYVGKTTDLSHRFGVHIAEKQKTRKANWIKSLRAQGLLPKLEILETVEEATWKSAEIYWIGQLKAWGFNLTNATPGGEGYVEAVHGPYARSEENRIRVSKLHKGRIPSQETKDKISKGLTGLKQSKEVIERRRLAKNTSPFKQGLVLHLFDSKKNYVAPFKSAIELAAYIGCKHNSVLNVISNDPKRQSLFGYTIYKIKQVNYDTSRN